MADKWLSGCLPMADQSRSQSGSGNKSHALSRDEISRFNQIVWQSHAIVTEDIPLTEEEVRADCCPRCRHGAAFPALVRTRQRLIDFNLGIASGCARSLFECRRVDLP
jgi:hypothetical protein